jgi:hypothetical protein
MLQFTSEQAHSDLRMRLYALVRLVSRVSRVLHRGYEPQLSALEAVEKALADFQDCIRFVTPEERCLISAA